MGFRERRERDRNNGYNRMTSHEGIFEKKKSKGFNNVGDNFPREERNTMQGRQETIIGNGTGKIKFFNKDKGFGFIERDGGEKDLFVHITQIPRGHEVREGDPVSFDIGEGRRGLVACNVTVG